MRASHGLTFTMSYVWSRSIDDGGTFRTGYAIPAAYSNNGKSWAADRIERSVSTSNQPNHAVVTGVWELPTGKTGLAGNAVERAIFGGYKFSGVYQAYSGSPLAITGSSCQTNQAQSTCEPTLNPAFGGTARINGKWGKGITAANTGAITYIMPSTCSTTSAPTGPFIAPNAPSGQTTCLNTALAPAYTFGNAPRTGAYNLYGPGNFDLDISLQRSFPLHFESSRLELPRRLVQHHQPHPVRGRQHPGRQRGLRSGHQQYNCWPQSPPALWPLRLLTNSTRAPCRQLTLWGSPLPHLPCWSDG